MKKNALFTSLFSFSLCCCLGEKAPTYDNPIDPDSDNFRGHPSKTLEETGGMVDDFEDQDSISLLGTGSPNWGPEREEAAGTNWSVAFTNAGGSASTSPIGHMRITVNFGTGSQNYAGASLILVDALGHSLDLRGYQGLTFQFRGDSGPLKVSLGGPSILDANDAATIIEVVPKEWQQVYIPLDDSLFGCNYKEGCPVLSSYLNEITSINFNLTGWPNTTRKVDIDVVQLIPVGGVIPSAAKMTQDFRIVNVVSARPDKFFFDFNDSSMVSPSSGAHANYWKTIENDVVGLTLTKEGAAPSSFRSLKMNYSFSTANTESTSSMAGLNLEIQPSFSGYDFSQVKGVRFFIKGQSTGKVKYGFRLWSDIVQSEQNKAYNSPEFMLSVSSDWSTQKEILFNQGQSCAYSGTTDCTSALDVIKKIQSFQFVVAIDQVNPVTGSISIDDVEFIY